MCQFEHTFDINSTEYKKTNTLNFKKAIAIPILTSQTENWSSTLTGLTSIRQTLGQLHTVPTSTQSILPRFTHSTIAF
jgi:hypothetical protein